MGQSFSDQIRSAVKKSGETYLGISEETGIPQPNLSRFMNGRSGLSLKSLDLLAEHLGLQVVAKPKSRKAGK